MKIERLTIEGFAPLRDQRIEFDATRINLLIEENEAVRRAIVAAIIAALYGGPVNQQRPPDSWSVLEHARPSNGRGYQVGIDIALPAPDTPRRYRIIRHSETDSVHVLDRTNDNQDITAHLIQQSVHRDLGPALWSLSRDQFVNVCCLRAADWHQRTNPDELTRYLLRMADSDNGRRTAADAIAVLTAAAVSSADSVSSNSMAAPAALEQARTELEQIERQLTEIESRRRLLAADLERISELRQRLTDAERERRVSLYLAARLQLQVLTEQSNRRRHLEQQLEAFDQEAASLGAAYHLPSHSPAELLQWCDQWKQLKHTLEGAEQALQHAQQALEEIDRQIGPLNCLRPFTQADFDLLNQAANTYEATAAELSRRQGELDAYAAKLTEQNIDLDEFERLSEPLGAMTPQQREEAALYPQRIQLLESERDKNENKVIRYTAAIEQIDKERQQKRESARLLWLVAALSLSLGGTFYLLDELTIAWSLAALGLAGLAIGFYHHQTARIHRHGELEQAHREVAQGRQESHKIRQEIAQHHDHMTTQAQLIGLLYPEKLAQACQEYNALIDQVQPYLTLRAQVAALRQQLEASASVIERLFRKAGLDEIKVARSSVEGFKHDVSRYRQMAEQRRPLETKVADLRRQLAEDGRQLDELSARLRAALQTSHHSNMMSLEEAVEQILNGAPNYQRWQQIQTEHRPRLQQALAELPRPDDVEPQLHRLQERLQAWEAEDASLSTLPPEKTQDEYEAIADRCQQTIQQVQQEVSYLVERVSAQLAQMERDRPHLLERHHQLRHYSTRLSQFIQAVGQATTTLQRAAEQMHQQWADALSHAAEPLLGSLNTEFEALSFDPCLNLTVLPKGDCNRLSPDQLREQLPLDVREQLVVLCQVLVGRYLAGGTMRLPLILEDPPAGTDEAQSMKLLLLLEQLSTQHQIIVLSGQPERYQSLKTKLPHLFAERIHECRPGDVVP